VHHHRSYRSATVAAFNRQRHILVPYRIMSSYIVPGDDYTPPGPPLDSMPIPPPPTTAEKTAQYGLSHTMIRVTNPTTSLDFYQRILGMTLIHRSDSAGGKFTNYFLVYPQTPVPTEPDARRQWMWSQQALLELCHNWGTEQDPKWAGYKTGNEPEHKGFGHIAVIVDNLDVACQRFTELGVRFIKRPSEGKMRHIAFIADPDGYWVEILARGGAL